jgi:hypothetical protein
MTIKATLTHGRTGKQLHVDDFWAPRRSQPGDQTLLVVTNPYSAHGAFKSATRTTAGTTTLVTPNANGSLLITDILISGEKQTSSSAEVRLTDGTNSATVFLASQVDAPPSFAHAFQGRLQGWRDARIDFITSGAGDATLLVCYTKVPEGLLFAEWDALR